VLIPPHPGITSAMGLLTADLEYHALRTAFAVKGAVDHDRLTALFDDMEEELCTIFDRDGVPPEKRRMLREGELRYVGQGYELKVDFPDGRLDAEALETVWQEFHEKHRAEYGHAFEAAPIEIVTVKVRGIGEVDKLGTPPEVGAGGTVTPVGQGRCVFRVNDELSSFETPYYDRSALPAGHAIHGPAILLQADSTTVVPPDWSFEVDRFGNVVMSRDEK